MNQNKKDLTGQRFGRLIAIKDVGKNKWGSRRWLCRCDCGNLTEAISSRLRAGCPQSCGCLQREKSRENIIRLHECRKITYKHGESHNERTRLYSIWLGMKARCYIPSATGYKYYGAKGIQVCNEWNNDYVIFRNWALINGYNNYLVLDRINDIWDYKSDNCQWISKVENARKAMLKRWGKNNEKQNNP